MTVKDTSTTSWNYAACGVLLIVLHPECDCGHRCLNSMHLYTEIESRSRRCCLKESSHSDSVEEVHEFRRAVVL